MGAAALLTILHNGETLKTQPVDGEIVVGRGEGCVIRLDDRAVSRQHAVLRPSQEGVLVEKKSEFAPLVVNGAECTKAVLKDGDVISIGPYLMRLQMQKEKPQLQPRVENSEPAQVLKMPEPTVPVAEVLPTVAEAAPVAPPEPTPDLNALQPEQPLVPDPVLGAPQAEMSVPDISQASGALQVGSPDGAELQVASSEVVQQPQSQVQDVSGGGEEDGKTKVASPGTIAVKLVFTPGSANYAEYEVGKDEVSMGRGKNCDIVLNDKKSSRKHAVIRRVGGKFVLKDLNSANGTYVNGVRIQEQELFGEDMVRIGEAEFKFLAMSADYINQQSDFMPLPQEVEEPEIEAEAPPEPLMSLDMGQQQAVAPVLADSTNSGIPGLGGMSNVPGIEMPAKRASLYEKYIKNFKNLPAKQKAVVAFVALALFYFIFIDEDEPEKAKGPAKKPAAVAQKAGQQQGIQSFESLSLEQKRFVEAQHQLAFDYYKNKEYDKAIYEVQKIFKLVPDYKDSKEIERYALEGKRKVEALEEERKRKEEEATLKAKVVQMVEEVRQVMKKKDYEQAKELFPAVLAIDPDNAQVSEWKKEIDAVEEAKRQEEMQKQVVREINKAAWEIFKEGAVLKKHAKYHAAIEKFTTIFDKGATDKSVIAKTRVMIKACHTAIRMRREPVLQKAKELEQVQEYAQAYQLYKRATAIDPPHPAGYAGMNRIKGILHDKAKAIYTEAVLAESYSDFVTARKKFKECLDMAPEDDIYYQRAHRKLNRYFVKGEPVQ